MFRLAPTMIGLVLALPFAPSAQAQPDPTTQQLIEQLRPRGEGSATRGIRLPSAPAIPAPEVQAAPAALPSPGIATPSLPPAMPVAPVAAPFLPTQSAPRLAPPAISAVTTAPADVAAVSITVTFGSGSAVLTPQAEQALAPLGRALSSAALAQYRFRIEGHTDTLGDAMINQRLSERRAEAVLGYLVQKHGVSPSRLESVGFGETTLLVPTADATSEPRNRRVQVLNIGG